MLILTKHSYFDIIESEDMIMSKNDYELSIYITNLLVETLPSNQKNTNTLKRLKIDYKKSYLVLQLMLSNELKARINEKKADEATEWKEVFHDFLEASITRDGFQVVSVLTLQPMIRSLVIALDKTMMDVQMKLRNLFQQLHQDMINTYNTSVTGCYGSLVEDFFELGNSYKNARKLQPYHYVIGLGNCWFFDELKFEEDYSLVEYKHIHLFDHLLEEKNYLEIVDLLIAIKKMLIDKKVQDSKTAYIYKEIFSVTIRHLFKETEPAHDEIMALNEAIIMFDTMFDDIDDIHEFYVQIFNMLTKQGINYGIHPHIRKAMSIIENKYNEPISLDSIADHLGITDAYLSRLFKSEMGLNFKPYLTNYRIDKAKLLLMQTDKKIDVIRQLVGYQSSTQFVRAFKKAEGMTPSKFRMYHLEG